MKKISPNKGEAAKNAARILPKAVGICLKIGGVGALAFGAVGCEITPAVPTQTLEGPVVNHYDGKAPNGRPAAYIVVDTDGNLQTTADQKHIVMSDRTMQEYPVAKEAVHEGATVRFKWNEYYENRGI